MKILVQWSKANPSDWEAIDSASWRHAAKKMDPTGTGLNLPVDNNPGWVSALNIQGVIFSGEDHYAIEHIADDEIRVTTWFDSPTDMGVDGPIGQVWKFKTLAPDPGLGGAINTRQSVVKYANGSVFAKLQAIGVDARPWADFQPPTDIHVRHGKLLSNDLHKHHKVTVSRVGWREFTDGLDLSELVNDRVPPQRARGRYNKPKGTKTYYCSDTGLATGVHKASHEYEASTGTAGASNQSETVAKASDELVFCFTTPANEPNSADWPSGDYRCQLDCNSCGADITYGMLTLGGSAGHFAQVDAGLTADQATWSQGEGVFSGTGLKLGTTGVINPGAGLASDRWEILVAAANSHAMDNEAIQLQLNEADDYTDGPWSAVVFVDAAAATATANAQSSTVTPGGVNVSAGLPTGTTNGLAATATPGGVNVDAGLPTGTADGLAAGVTPGSVSVDAGLPVGTVDSQSASVTPGGVNIDAGLADAAIDTFAADTVITTNVDAELADGTAGTLAAGVTPGSVNVNAGLADGAVDSQGASVTPGGVSIDASLADAAGVALGASATPGSVNVDAALDALLAAALAGTAVPGGVAVDVSLSDATVDSLAADVTPGGVNVDAGLPDALAGALGAGVTPGGVSVGAGLADGAGGALAADVDTSLRIDAGFADALAGALGAGAAPGGVNVDAQFADSAADTQPGTVTPGGVSINADVADALMQSQPAAIFQLIDTDAGLADAQASTVSPAVFSEVQTQAGAAQATANALNPTVVVICNAIAAVASAVANSRPANALRYYIATKFLGMLSIDPALRPAVTRKSIKPIIKATKVKR